MTGPAVDNRSQTSRTPSAPGHRRRGLLALASLLALGLPGCQSISVSTGNVAMLRVIDASPDAPGLDFYENGSAVAYGVGFGTVSSYVAFTPGNYSISTDQGGTRTQITASNASLANTRQYTALISNVNVKLQETILQDQNTPAPTNQIAVRILNESTRIASGVDVYLVPGSGKLSATSPVASGLNFGANSGYINVPAGTYAIVVVPAGTVTSSSTDTLYAGSQINYAQGAVRTVVLIDQQIVTSPGVQALVAADFDYNGTTT